MLIKEISFRKVLVMGTGEQQDMEMWVRNSGHSPNLGRLKSFENQGSRDDWKIANL